MSGGSEADSGWWRVMGGLAIAHVLIMFASFGLQKVAPLGASKSVVQADHVTTSGVVTYAGECLSVISFLLFLAAAVLLGRLLATDSVLGGWIGSLVVQTGGSYVVLTLVAVAQLGTATYLGHHGVDVSTVSTLVTVHWFLVFAATAFLAVFTAVVGVGVLSTGALPRSVGWSGIGVGVLCLVVVPAGAVNGVTLLWVLWFVVLAATALRRRTVLPAMAAGPIA